MWRRRKYRESPTSVRVRAGVPDAFDETVSHEFIRSLAEIVKGAVGPIGAIVLDEKIVAMGESSQTFPKLRLDELIREIDEEISFPEVKAQFHTQVNALRDAHSL